MFYYNISTYRILILPFVFLDFRIVCIVGQVKLWNPRLKSKIDLYEKLLFALLKSLSYRSTEPKSQFENN